MMLPHFLLQTGDLCYIDGKFLWKGKNMSPNALPETRQKSVKSKTAVKPSADKVEKNDFAIQFLSRSKPRFSLWRFGESLCGSFALLLTRGFPPHIETT